MAQITPDPTFHDVLARMIDANGKPMSQQLAEYVLEFAFSEAERKRVDELCAKNRAGELTEAEDAELEQFIKAGDFLSLMQAKAHETLGNGS